MTVLTFDLEADGLYFEATKIWCICAVDMDTGDRHSYHGGGLMNGLNEVLEADMLIGHNIINYDLALIKKLYGKEYNGRVFDTMIFSQLLKPERWKGHSLGAFGELLKYPKVEHEDWSQYSPEMLERCKVDVELNVKVYHMLQREAGEYVEGVTL